MSQNLILTLPDGKALEVPAGATVRDAAAQIGPRLAQAAIAGKIDGMFVDIRMPLLKGGKFEVVTMKSPDAAEVYRHSMAHIMAEAVQKLFPEAQFGIGPTIENGFYYDFQLSRALTMDDLEHIEKEMQAVIAAKSPFTREELDRASALELFKKLNQP
ncbi:MAG TPA: TGS domain-containing protein, partial [Candidatus Ozemobacteraceae bacterium]|nr:TGS domain-containing protein [Candidatus Ozemobacteraceae bacterium]